MSSTTFWHILNMKHRNLKLPKNYIFLFFFFPQFPFGIAMEANEVVLKTVGIKYSIFFFEFVGLVKMKSLFLTKLEC